MEGVVAKRTLKRSYYLKNNISIDNDEEAIKSKSKSKNRNETLKEKIIFRLAIQLVTTIAIFTFVALVKIMNIQIVLEADITKKIKTEFRKNYSKEKIKQDVFNMGSTVYSYIEGVIPDNLENKVKEEINKIKNMLINLEKEEVEIYEETSNNKSENKEVEVYDEPLGVGTSVVEEQYITAVSSMSFENNIVEKIKGTGIKFVKPTTGTITSNFGAREVIFEGVDSYHTGVDIANKKGTKVVSSIEGKVTSATNNKYNGNYVVVENGDIKTIYCHLNKISVKKGAKVKAGTKIGEMGSTGYSTGPHLHFEIEYKGEKINPRLVVNI
ncbi:MAG: M23 family metallopeptidase [Clostridia bacterium]|nr:M23 family metallopeptidase [Clostridia bacterium]